MPSTESAIQRAIARLWQPKRMAFWLMLAFNLLSSALAWTLHWLQPTGAALILLTLLTLANAFMGWWLLAMLWREGAPSEHPGDAHVQSPADQQDR